MTHIISQHCAAEFGATRNDPNKSFEGASSVDDAILMPCKLVSALSRCWHLQYFEDIQSSRDGLLSAPITIKGPASAIIRGESGERIVLINHDHIHLEGFSVNGVG